MTGSLYPSRHRTPVLFLLSLAASLLLGLLLPIASADDQSPPAPPTPAAPSPTPATPSATPAATSTPAPTLGSSASPAPSASPSPAPDSAKVVYIIPIHGEINNLTVDFLNWGLAESDKLNRAVIVLDIDTPGGLVSSAIDICRTIKSLKDVRIVAWVHPEAISAGSMISLACDDIVITKRGKLGDCAPILLSPQGGLQSLGPTERAKMDSYILAEFRDSAKLRGYPIPLAESMVTLGPAVYRIVNTESHETKIVFADELKDFGLDLDQPADQVSSTGWKIQQLLRKSDTLLTMVDHEAIDFGFAKQFVNNDAELLQYLQLPDAKIHRFDPSWSQSFFGWLTTPAISGILLLGVILGIYFELQSPGLGLGSVIAIVCGAVLLGAPYLTGMADMVELLIVLAGVILLLIEIFITPGFGVLGLTGILLIFTGIILTFTPPEPGPNFIPQLPATWDGLLTGFITLVSTLFVAVIIMVFCAKYFGSLPLLNRLILSDAGLTEPPDTGPEIIGRSDPASDQQTVNVGDAGLAVNDLRPAGRARFGPLTVDVVADGAWIESGSSVAIITIAGNRVVVRKT